jgi:hypothetical protein
MPRYDDRAQTEPDIPQKAALNLLTEIIDNDFGPKESMSQMIGPMRSLVRRRA